MYKVLVMRPNGDVFTYEHSISHREEAEYAMSEASLSFDNKHKIYIELESESEYVDNIQES